MPYQMKKFLCDEMCLELGRWLRAAGYDTVIIDTPIPDKEIFKKATAENRLLLTRDKDFKKFDPKGKIVIYLRSDALDEWAKQLKEEGINWLFHPFSRCLHCNSLLEKTTPPLDLEHIPKHVKKFWSCPLCGGIFWLGSHTERMEEQLKTWKNATF